MCVTSIELQNCPPPLDQLAHKDVRSQGGQYQRYQRAFTLIELLVVLVIGVMLIGVVPVAFERLREGSQYRDTVRGLVHALRQARQTAVTHRQTVVFVVDLAGRQYGLDGAPLKPLSDLLEIRATTGQSADTVADGNARFAFMEDGGSTGGSIEVLRRSGTGTRIRVDWMLGNVTLEPQQP